jgi:hypothetical protein
MLWGTVRTKVNTSQDNLPSREKTIERRVRRERSCIPD